jgi:hypothetical protein
MNTETRHHNRPTIAVVAGMHIEGQQETSYLARQVVLDVEAAKKEDSSEPRSCPEPPG